MDASPRLPKAAWTADFDQDGEVLEDTRVAELTGLLDLEAWTGKIPGVRILVREEPLHPRYRKRATEREIKLGKRCQLIATSTRRGQIAWLDARHRSHVQVESNVKQAKSLGLNRWPSRHWAINVAWTQVVALAARPCRRLEHGAGTARRGLTPAPPTRRQEKTPPGPWKPVPRHDSRPPALPAERKP